MSPKTKITPLPWKIDDSPWSKEDPKGLSDEAENWILGKSKKVNGQFTEVVVARVVDAGGGFSLRNANATYIERAVNCHEELLAAAKAAVTHLRACEKGKIGHPFKSASLPLLERAIAKAEGK